MNNQATIPITVNDKRVEIPDGISILELLDQLEIHHRAIAVELNLEIQPKDKFGKTTLSSNDRLEIVTLVGGG